LKLDNIETAFCTLYQFRSGSLHESMMTPHHPPERHMKFVKWLAASALVACGVGSIGTANAGANVSIGIGLPAPGVVYYDSYRPPVYRERVYYNNYYAPPPVRYYAPPPPPTVVYYAPPPRVIVRDNYYYRGYDRGHRDYRRDRHWDDHHHHH
jgi:hypothetical protein